jgi:hypothetical protein
VRGDTDAEIYQNAKMAYRAYRAERFHTVLRLEVVFRFIRDSSHSRRRARRESFPYHSVASLGLAGGLL